MGTLSRGWKGARSGVPFSLAWVLACGFVDCSGSAGRLFSAEGGVSGAGVLGVAGRTGRAGSSGSAGRGGTGGQAGFESGHDAGAGDGALNEDGGIILSDGGDECQDDGGCNDGNECTEDSCSGGRCSHVPRGTEVACGDSVAGCKAAGNCDGAGACVAPDAPNGSACEGGSCTLGECVAGQPVGCPAGVVAALPFQTSWRTVGGVSLYDTGCNDAQNTPDFAVVFSAPVSAVYRFEAAGEVGSNDPETPQGVDDDASLLADSVLAIVAGSCAGFDARQLACNDDINGNSNGDSRIDLALVAGQTVTVYAGEFHERLPGGGSGTLSIRQLDD